MTDTLERFKSLRSAAAEALRKAESCDIHLEAVRQLWAAAESPIEKVMGEAIACCPDLNLGRPAIVNGPVHLQDPTPLVIAPQCHFERWRVDFAIMWRPSGRNLVVECDGYDFHDRTPEQAARDKARDRHLLVRGWPVMRFTGSEITRQIDLCLADVVDYLTGARGG